MSSRIQRIQLRCEPCVKVYLARAAEAAHVSLTDFIVESALSQSRRLIKSGKFKTKRTPTIRDHRRLVP